MTIRVLIAEDYAIVREGVRLILDSQADIEVIGEAVDGLEAVDMACRLLPDVVCMDLSMPGIDGMEATRRIKAECSSVRVLALTVHESDEYFFEMLKAGASGYVLKGAASSELVDAVRAVARGEAFLHPSVAQRLVDDYVVRGESSDDDPLAALSPREREIAVLVGEGLTNKDIAEKLVISPSTVQTHVGHIVDKLGLANRTELLRYVLRGGAAP